MATLKTANGKCKYFDSEAKHDVITYVLNPYKSPHGYRGYAKVNPQDPIESMMEVSEKFGKSTGVQLRHFIISFSSYGVNDYDVVNKIAQAALWYFGREYQGIYAVHEKPQNPHIHIVINSVSYVDGHRYYGTKKEFYDMMKYLRGILFRHGIKELIYVRNDEQD